MMVYSIQFLFPNSELYKILTKSQDVTFVEKLDEEKIGLLTDIFSSNQETLKMADTKSSFILGISGVMLSFIVPINKTGFSSYKLYCLDFAVLCLFAATISQLLTIFPRINNSNSKNILFYKGILQCELEEYKKNIKKMDSQKVIDDYIASIYNLAIIQKKKFRWLNWGIIFLIVSIIAISLSFFL